MAIPVLYSSQGPNVRVAFDQVRIELETLADWGRTERFKPLSKGHEPLGELRFKTYDEDKYGRRGKARPIRPVGLVVPADRVFILFGAGEEIGNGRYTPENAFDRAKMLLTAFQEGRGLIYDVD